MYDNRCQIQACVHKQSKQTWQFAVQKEGIVLMLHLHFADYITLDFQRHVSCSDVERPSSAIWKRPSIFLLTYLTQIPTKGQAMLKWFFRANVSSKKRRNEFDKYPPHLLNSIQKTLKRHWNDISFWWLFLVFLGFWAQIPSWFMRFLVI